ncbi:MAG: zinc-binding dehydrogenase, partial [Albidovulum sp.]
AAHSTAEDWIDYRKEDVAAAIKDLTGGAGVDRIVEVAFAANQATSLAVLKPGGTISAYASASDMRPPLDFYGFLFRNVTLRMLIIYQIDREMHRRGEAQLSEWLEQGAFSHAVVPGGGLANCAAAHRTVESGDKLGTVVLDVAG